MRPHFVGRVARTTTQVKGTDEGAAIRGDGEQTNVLLPIGHNFPRFGSAQRWLSSNVMPVSHPFRSEVVSPLQVGTQEEA